jgi:hypothetical protein
VDNTTASYPDLATLEASNDPRTLGLATLLRRALQLPARAANEPYSVDGLGKFPVVIAVGDTLTREQTNEVMLRTTRWPYLSCNDDAWNDMVVYILGVADKLDESTVKLPNGDVVWDWQYRHELTERFGDGIQALKLFALDNPSIMSHRRGSGWLDWSGRIRSRYTEGSKWTTVEEVEADWRDIAAAFPFLRLRAQLAAGDYLNDLPAGTVGAEWIVENGTCTRVEEPGKPLIGPERWWQRHHEDWYQFPWWFWKVATPVTGLYRWQRRRHAARWPQIGPWGLAMHWSERGVPAPRLIEAVDQLKDAVMPDIFIVTEDHLKLLGRLNLRWDDAYKGAVGADTKMPYGSSWVFHDIAEIIDPEGFAAVPDGNEEAISAYEQANEERFLRIHEETFTALDIVLRTGQFTPGRYRRTDPWAHNWERIGSEGASV